MNNLVCWKEGRTNKWEMVKGEDCNALLLNLMSNNKVDNHSIFIIPVNAIIGGIWLMSETHKSSRVDFRNFYEDFGVVYKAPKVDEPKKKILSDYENAYGQNTKYGWISPEGKYFHCEYQGHISLAERICFGMIETNNSERYLEEHGWCKIYKPLFDEQYSVYVGGKYTITDAQMKTLIKMGLDKANNISEMLCKKLRY